MTKRVTNYEIMAQLIAMEEDRRAELKIVSARLEDASEKIDKVHDAIYGDGKPGLNVRVTLTEDFIAGVKKWMWVVVGATTSSAIGVIFFLIREIVKEGMK
jgi:hypothetical protein